MKGIRPSAESFWVCCPKLREVYSPELPERACINPKDGRWGKISMKPLGISNVNGPEKPAKRYADNPAVRFYQNRAIHFSQKWADGAVAHAARTAQDAAWIIAYLELCIKLCSYAFRHFAAPRRSGSRVRCRSRDAPGVAGVAVPNGRSTHKAPAPFARNGAGARSPDARLRLSAPPPIDAPRRTSPDARRMRR